MRFLKSLAGYAALIGLVGGLNLLVFRQNPFALSVLFTFGAGILAGLVWIGLTILLVVRRSAKEGRALYGLNTVLMSTLFLGICIVLYAFAAHLNKSWDLTQEGRRELAPQTMQVLQNLDKDVNVIAFFLKVDDELVSIAREKTERFLPIRVVILFRA